MVDWKPLFVIWFVVLDGRLETIVYVIWFVVLDGRLETIVCYMICCIRW